MLNNKKLTFVISLLIAIALWVYVVGTKDPITTKNVSGVPVTFTNMETLIDDGYAVKSLDVEKIDVEVSSNKSKIPDLDESKIVAYIDAGQLTYGDNKCKIKVDVPEDFTCEEQSVMKAEVMVEKAVTVEKDVQINFKGTAPDGKEPTVKSIQDKKIAVTGAESLISDVAYVAGDIDSSKVTTEASSSEVTLYPSDSEGNPVKYMSLSKEKTEVSSILYSTKTVDLEVPVYKGNDTDIERTVEAPETVTIKGNDDALEKVSSLKAETVDVSKVTADGNVKISVKLPDGVMLAKSSNNLVASVKVTEQAKAKSLSVSLSSISIEGSSSAKITGTGNISVTVTGNKDVIDKITANDLKLYVEVTEDMTGTQTLKIMCDKPSGVTSITFSPETVDVEIGD